jgi:membrane protease YdiL (CAAX protease family)
LGKGAFYGVIFFLIYPITVIIFGLGQFQLSLDKVYITIQKVFMGFFSCFMVALFEESLFRGYILQKLLNRFPIWTSVGISSLIFGLLHYNSYHDASYVIIGLLNASLIGIVLSIVVIKTHSIMTALGFHLTWNLMQDVILNKNSLLFNFKIHSGIWCGNYGSSETGLIVTLIVILMFISIFLYLKNISKKIKYMEAHL